MLIFILSIYLYSVKQLGSEVDLIGLPLRCAEDLKINDTLAGTDSSLLADKDAVRHFDSTVPIRSSIEAVWEVLTDYDNIEDFQPGIEKSELLETLPNGEKKIGQQMVQRFLFFKKRLRLVVRIVEMPPNRIEFSIIEGDFKTYDGAWIIDPNLKAPQLRLVLSVEPNFRAPRSAIDFIVRASSEKSLLSVVEEAERREK